MELKIATYNISGGFYCGDESQEYLDREAAISVDNKLLDEIIKTINEEKIDIICFQEIITTKETQYIETIVNKTNLKYYDSYELSPCNLVKDTNCGLAILSKYPITNSIKEIFTKKNDVMAFITASDEYTSVSLTLFPDNYKKFNNIKKNNIIKVTGKVEKRFDKYQIIVNNLIILK